MAPWKPAHHLLCTGARRSEAARGTVETRHSCSGRDHWHWDLDWYAQHGFPVQAQSREKQGCSLVGGFRKPNAARAGRFHHRTWLGRVHLLFLSSHFSLLLPGSVTSQLDKARHRRTGWLDILTTLIHTRSPTIEGPSIANVGESL